jgi:Flp pilus assembly secretin CpaC
MKYVLSICVLSAICVAAYGQQTGNDLRVAATYQVQPDSTGRRLQELRRRAGELEQAGNRAEAAAIAEQANQEKQALLRRLDVLQAEAEQIRQAVGAGTFVQVHVQFFEVSLTKLRSMGIDMKKLSGDPPAKSQVVPNDTMQLSVVDDGSEALQLLKKLRKDNLIKAISEPTLVTLSGKTACINTGGELKVPRQPPEQPLTIEYGTKVEVTPQVLGNKMRLDIKGRLADLDYAHRFQMGKETVPGVRTRSFATGAELQSGQTLLIGGLKQVQTEVINHGVPVISEIPYAGAMFRSVEEKQNEIGLFVLVRPEIVPPAGMAAVAAGGAQGGIQR